VRVFAPQTCFDFVAPSLAISGRISEKKRCQTIFLAGLSRFAGPLPSGFLLFRTTLQAQLIFAA
jgi:hypothetical protein